MGWTTWGTMHKGIDAWPCKMPSRTQMSPNETLSRRRATGSGRQARKENIEVPAPSFEASRRETDRKTFHAASTKATINSAHRPWCNSAARKAETIAGLLVLRPVFMPGMAVTSPGRVPMRPRSPRRCYRAGLPDGLRPGASSQKGAPGKEHLSGPCLDSRATRPESSREFRCAELEPCDLANIWWPAWTLSPGSPTRLGLATPELWRRSSGPATSQCGACVPHSSASITPTIPRRRPSSGPLAPYRSSGASPQRELGCWPSHATSASTNIGGAPGGGDAMLPSAPAGPRRQPTRAQRSP